MIDLDEWAGMILPSDSRHRVLALLYAYFDESGTHASAEKTVVAGFVGRALDWYEVQRRWREAMQGLPTFHYTKMRGKFGYAAFNGVPQDVRGKAIERCADVLAEAPLRGVAAGFKGDWTRAISQGDGWGIRFPSRYHFCLEACVEQIQAYAADEWDGENVALVFAEHDEYAMRAQELWRTFRGNGFWRNLSAFSYASMEAVPALQAADMIVYETYQCLGETDPSVWRQWPLMARLLDRNAEMRGQLYDESSFIDMMRRTDADGRKYLKTVS
ncbi:MAG: DUF3800 domain-containing protein [Vitreimonas sp.]